MTTQYLEIMNQTFHNHYANQADVWTSDRGLRDSPQFVLKTIHAKTSLSVLDIGAGKAADAPEFLIHGHRYFALDLVEHQDWVALQNTWGDRFEAEANAFQNFSSEQKFDLIYDSGCFHHQHPNELIPYLSKATGLLKPQGFLALNVYTPADVTADGQTQVFKDGRFAHVFNVQQLSELLNPFPLKLKDSIRLPHANGKSFYLLAIFERTL